MFPFRGRIVQRAGALRPRYRSDPARCMTGSCVCSLSRELVRREIAEARIRANFVVMAAPALDDRLGLRPRPEPFETQALVAELAVEAFGDAILPRLAGLDQRRVDALRNDPGQEHLRHELRAVVAAWATSRNGFAPLHGSSSVSAAKTPAAAQSTNTTAAARLHYRGFMA